MWQRISMQGLYLSNGWTNTSTPLVKSKALGRQEGFDRSQLLELLVCTEATGWTLDLNLSPFHNSHIWDQGTSRRHQNYNNTWQMLSKRLPRGTRTSGPSPPPSAVVLTALLHQHPSDSQVVFQRKAHETRGFSRFTVLSHGVVTGRTSVVWKARSRLGLAPASSELLCQPMQSLLPMALGRLLAT